MVLDLEDIHRATLQTVMNHGTIEEERLCQIFKLVCEKFTQYQQNDEEAKRNLDRVVETINEKISRFDQTVIKHKYGLNEIEYYVFTSTAKTALAKLQNCFNEFELEYFKQMFTNIIINERLCIKPRDALNLQSNLNGKVTKIRAEKLTDLWITTGYFYRNNDLIYLGPKSISEFAETIQNLGLDHIKKCSLCEDIAAWGITCNSCKTATFHKQCIQKFLARSEKCPSCKKEWTQSMEQ
ncbi:hypothetical protein PVAND_008119 [Polypedilum vanderplanki]|uniref:Non-structural maintenance of chromosomes element 1 homolog n=1 Tax=Polypedilum vanderplanki TaxID=319348 RepID=A0A9J6C906_POLVA|nr:hypothetical protein PVAND_008119 [Polypedilum vanderplanki]